MNTSEHRVIERYCQNEACGIRIWGSGEKYCSIECSSIDYPLQERLRSKGQEIVGPLTYPRSPSGKILARPQGMAKKLSAKLPDIPAEQIGGVDWTFTKMFGSVQEGVKMVEALVAGQGSKADQRWVTLLLAYKNKQEEESLELGRPVPSLNQICALLDLPFGEFLASITEGTRQLAVALGKQKVFQSLDQVIDSSLAASALPEGVKDREMLLKMGGMLEDKGGVNVSVNQQVGVVVKPEELKAPLRQFRAEIEDLDDLARSVEGEVLEDVGED